MVAPIIGRPQAEEETMTTCSMMTGSALAILVAGVSLAVAAPRTHDTELDLIQGAKRLMIQTDDDVEAFTNTSFVQVTAGTIAVPAAQTGILVARFTAESVCSGVANSWCSIRIVCDGVELQPASGRDFAFDSVGTGNWKSLSVTRRTDVLTGGTHTCEVQTANRLANGAHTLDDWAFEVEFWRR
jgi:hypothetical protein